MTSQEISQIVRSLEKAVSDPLRRELQDDIRAQIEAYRRGMFVRDEWCCNEMVKFARDTWDAAKPKPPGHFGSVAYQLRGHNVNFCPFCGISFAAPSAQAIPRSA